MFQWKRDFTRPGIQETDSKEDWFSRNPLKCGNLCCLVSRLLISIFTKLLIAHQSLLPQDWWAVRGTSCLQPLIKMQMKGQNVSWRLILNDFWVQTRPGELRNTRRKEVDPIKMLDPSINVISFLGILFILSDWQILLPPACLEGYWIILVVPLLRGPPQLSHDARPSHFSCFLHATISKFMIIQLTIQKRLLHRSTLHFIAWESNCNNCAHFLFCGADWWTMRLFVLSQQQERGDEKLHVHPLNYHAWTEATQIQHNGHWFMPGTHSSGSEKTKQTKQPCS